MFGHFNDYYLFRTNDGKTIIVIRPSLSSRYTFTHCRLCKSDLEKAIKTTHDEVMMNSCISLVDYVVLPNAIFNMLTLKKFFNIKNIKNPVTDVANIS